MTITRLLAILLLMTAARPAVALDFWLNSSDHLIPTGDASSVLSYMSKDKLAVARRTDALVRMSPSWTPGYVVGVTLEAKTWHLIGYGTQARQPSDRPPQEVGCSRPIGESLGRSTMALWGKALSSASPRKPRIVLDGESFDFALKNQNHAASVSSPDRQSQPRMYGLSQVAEAMFEACLTGKGLDAWNRQMSDLTVRM